MPRPPVSKEKGMADRVSGPEKRHAWSDLRRSEKILVGLFILGVVGIFLSVLFSYPLTSIEHLLVIIPILGGLLSVFFLVGIIVLVLYIKKGSVSMGWLIIVLVIFSVVYSVSLYETNGNDIVPSPFQERGLAGHMGFFYLFALLVLLFYIFIAFGMMWLLTIIQRLTLSDTLEDIRHVSIHYHENIGKMLSKKGLMALGLRFAFNIPHQLDTGTLKISPENKRIGFPWSEFVQAFSWNMIFGVFIILLITLNPFLKELPAFQDVFGLSAIVSFFIPFMVISWYIFKRLDARIKGPVRDFRLFNGLKSRVAGSILAVSTLIIFIRMAIQTMDFKYLVWEFFKLFLDYSAVVLITTFVYFNYFEEEVAGKMAQLSTKGLVKMEKAASSDE